MCRKMMWVFGLRRLTSSAIKGHGVRRIPKVTAGRSRFRAQSPRSGPLASVFFKVLAHAWWVYSPSCVQNTILQIRIDSRSSFYPPCHEKAHLLP
jgi:hypothetical protein